MYRVLVPVLSLLLCGCSMANSTGVSAGLAANDDEPTSAVASSRVASEPREGTGSIAEGAPKRYASNDDHIPRGTFEKAPSGALANRDYSTTQLDPEKARQLINAYRKEKGLKPLKLSVALIEAAKAHSRDLAKWDRISHYGSDGSNPWDRVKRAGYHAKVAAENVGTGQASLEEVIKGWQASPGHNKNLLLTDVEHMGIALVQDPRTEFKTFWTLVVGASL